MKKKKTLTYGPRDVSWAVFVSPPLCRSSLLIPDSLLRRILCWWCRRVTDVVYLNK
jgi:hypothetical protein